MTRRVVVAQFGHETNSFVDLPATLDDFRHRHLLYGQSIVDAFAGTESFLAGFFAAGEAAGWDVAPIIAAGAGPGGVVAADCYDYIANSLLDELRAAQAAGPVDGVLLAVHGAMVVEDIDDGEGELFRSIREFIGEQVPLVACLDLHGNISDTMALTADAMVLYKTYPHVDRAECGLSAASILERTMNGEVKPVTAICRPPFLPPLLSQFTGREPMAGIISKVREVEKQPGILSASAATGFPYTDVYEAGFCAVVVADGDRDLAQSQATAIAQAAWEHRHAFDVKTPAPREALAAALQSPETPVVLTDPGDNTGAGAPGSDSSILQLVIELGLKPAALAAWWSPEAVAQALAVGPGGVISLSLTSTANGAKPVKVLAGVRSLAEGTFVHKGPNRRGMINRLGTAAVLTILGPEDETAAADDSGGRWATGKPGVEVVVSDHRYQPVDAEVFRSLGIEPLDYRAVILKSSVHFRADFTPLARGGVVTMDTEGPSAPSVRHFTFKKLRRPIFPLDEVDWEPGQHDDGTRLHAQER